MAIVAAPSLNLSYIGNGPTGSNQSIADLTSGPRAKTLFAYGVATNGNTTTGANAAPVGFIDGVQSLGKTIVLQLQSVDAPVTYLGTANTAFYHSVQGCGQVKVGDSVTTSGFANGGNNATNTVTYVLPTAIGVTNASSVAEVNPAGTLVDNQTSVPVAIDVYFSGSNADTPAVLIAAGNLIPSTISATGFILNWTALATTAQIIHFGAIISFSN